MGADLEAIIYKGHDNPLTWGISRRKRVFDLAENGVTKVAVKVGDQAFNSDEHPDQISFSGAAVTASLGKVVTSGVGLIPGRIILFDAAHPDGQVWQEFTFEVR